MRNDSEELVDGLRPFKRRRGPNEDDEDGDEDISMAKHPKAKKPRLSAAGFRSTDLAEGIAPSSVKTGTHGQFEKEKEKRALEKARAEGRYIMLQAALRGKRRIVRLPIPGPRLAQVVAQQAAKAALTAGEKADAEHEVEEGATAGQADQTDGADGDEEVVDLLKSDIAPRKEQNPVEYYEQRQKEGFVVSGATKKAMIPVEKDTSYGYYPSKPKLKAGVPQQNGKRVKKMGKGNVEYEEVDIGSDDDFEDGLFMTSGTAMGTTASSSHRRSIPNYLQDRYGGEDLPNELPPMHKDKGRPKPSRPGPTEKAKAVASPTTKAKPTAGKMPSMRPSAGSSMTMDGAADDAGAMSDEYLDVDEIVPDPVPTSFVAVNGTSTSAPASRPSSSRAPTKPQLAKSPARPNQRQQVMDEQNRLAKLQALEMVTGDSSPPPAMTAGRAPYRSARVTVSMAETLDIDSDEEDGVEEVPARGAIRA
jgi:hypothetical protein